MILTAAELIGKLPEREFFFVGELAEALGVTKRAIQYCAKNHSIGRKVRHGINGMWIFFPEDLHRLVENVHGEVGNPNNIRIHRERLKK